MLKQIDFTLSGTEYSILYDSGHMTDKQAKLECEFVGWGKGCDESLYPYYLIVTKLKKPILSCIKKHILEESDK